MKAKLKTRSFIDTLIFDLGETSLFRATLLDGEGKVCSTLTTEFAPGLKTFCWSGFNDLPYGEYTLELTNEDHKEVLSLVKRI
ncbi:MAG: hypothetical protein KIT80_03540 [Chitinophagaceae bacterium]|nr:hypothetical protein [Chitinophagaceae bacterium]MCW5925960.1 hypothetical protein [Chitinophagaceae bacterium]